MTKYKVVAVEPMKKGYVTEMTFEEIQQFAGGYVKSKNIYDDKHILFNEDGERLQLQPNRHMILQDFGHQPLMIQGNFVVIKSKGSDFVDMNEEEVKEATFIFRVESDDATIFI